MFGTCLVQAEDTFHMPACHSTCNGGAVLPFQPSDFNLAQVPGKRCHCRKCIKGGRGAAGFLHLSLFPHPPPPRKELSLHLTFTSVQNAFLCCIPLRTCFGQRRARRSHPFRMPSLCHFRACSSLIYYRRATCVTVTSTKAMMTTYVVLHRTY